MKKELGIFTLFAVLVMVVAIISPSFRSADNLQNTSRLIGIYGIFSIGMGLIIITGGIDLSVGSVFALQGVLLGMMVTKWPDAWPLAALLTILGTMVLGLIHGLLIAKVKLQPFIVTLCGLLIYRGLARFIAGDSTVGFGENPPLTLYRMANGNFMGIQIPLILLVIVAGIFWVVLHRSVYGRYLYAIGRNEDAARYSGINAAAVMVSVYVVSMILTGGTGVLLAAYSQSISPSIHGNILELYGIAAAVMGGCSLRGGEGSILGIVIGTALLLLLRNIVNMLEIPSSLEYVVMGVVILLSAIVDQIIVMQRAKRTLAK